MTTRRPALLTTALACWLATAACFAEEMTTLLYIDPDPATGSSAAVSVPDQPLAHTTQILPVDAQGRLAGNDAAGQFRQVLDNIDTALRPAGSDLQRTAKLNIYLASRQTAKTVERVLAKRFSGREKPAVSFVVTPLPVKDALVAADAVAVADTSTADKAAGVTQFETAAVCPRGSRIYISGQAQRDQSLEEATRKTLIGLKETLQFLKRDVKDVVQLKAFMTPMTDAEAVRRQAVAIFGKQTPLVLVQWQSGATVPIEIELIAWGGSKPAQAAVEYITPPGMKASPVFSRLARIDGRRTIFISGLYATPPQAAIQDEKAEGQRQVREIFTALQDILKKSGSDLRHLAKATYYVSSPATSSQLNALRPRYYDPKRPPAASKAAVADVGRAGLGLTIDMIAVPAGTGAAKNQD